MVFTSVCCCNTRTIHVDHYINHYYSYITLKFDCWLKFLSLGSNNFLLLLGDQMKKRRHLVGPVWWKWGSKRFVYELFYGRPHSRHVHVKRMRLGWYCKEGEACRCKDFAGGWCCRKQPRLAEDCLMDKFSAHFICQSLA